MTTDTLPGMPADADSRAAVLSPCRTYRYELHRNWSNDYADVVTFVMLNPSTADARVDDPTIRRCVRFARDWGYGGIVVVNLYALRATQPTDMLAATDPVGPDNDAVLESAARYASANRTPMVAAWGVNARPERVAAVLALPCVADRLTCLGVTKDGHPRHPLYVRSDATLTPWAPPAPTEGPTPC